MGAWAAIPKPLPSLHVEGKWLVDTYGNHVVLHGCMDTPSMWFNGNRWTGGYNDTGAKNCLEYFEKQFTALEVANCDIFRLHLDPAWTNDDGVSAAGFTTISGDKSTDPTGQEVSGEANIHHFSSARLKKFLKSLYIPLMLKAMDHGMYVVVRPPGVCPGQIRVDGYYQKYLLEVWDIVSKDETIRSYPGQISIELANEPIGVKEANGSESAATLHNFFQPIVDKIRENGFTGIIWVPGSGYQSNYRGYGSNPITGNNIGYAVHDYPGWYNCSDERVDQYGLAKAKQDNYNSFLDAVPVVTKYPIFISEVDWSPHKEPKVQAKNADGSLKYNEMGQPVYENLGTWATGSTSKWGACFKNLLEKFGNISMTLTHPHDYIDLDKMMKDPKNPVPAFNGNTEACSGACWVWYAEYAQVDNPVPDYVNEAPVSDLGNGKFMNPVVRADFPDPDVIRVDDTYYMVSTTMSLFPGATILKSRDMVNWEYCCQPLQQLANTDNYNLKNGKDAYAGGMWACSMKYYNGKFYLLINGNDAGGWILTAENPEGTWQKKKLSRIYYDPGMLFDNGKVYIACGIENINMCELDENFNFKQEKTVISNKPQLEGSHLYKKNGYYYIYATYGGWPSGQAVFRSKNIFGPYEEKMVVEKSYDGQVNTIHQGALIEDVKGKWWTIMQEDLGALGRFPNLQPVKWVDDWPVVGNNGKPYKSFVDEITKPETTVTVPQGRRLPTTDNFRDYPLGMQWEWNHNPDDNAWSVFERAGWLRLKTNTVVGKLHQARNMLTQRIFINKDKATTGTVRLDVSRLQEGDRAGICIFQDPYAAIALEVKNGNRQIVWFQDGVKSPGDNFTASEKTQAVTLTDNIVYLRAAIKYGDNKAYFYYSTDGTNWTRLGGETPQSFNLSVFFGSRFGLFCYSTQTSGGSADFDWFSTESSYDEEALYGEVKTELDPKMFTVTKIVPAKQNILTLVGGANSTGITATFLDKHTENVSAQAIFEPEDEGIVEFRNGQMSGLSQGTTRVAVSYTDAFGNKADTAFTAQASYFPLDEQYITPDLAGKKGTYKRYNSYGKFTFAGTDTQIGWNYANYMSKGINLTDFKYLVVRLYYANTTAKASINFYASKTSMKGGCSVPLSTGKETVIDLQNLKYTFGSNKDKKFTPSTVYKVTFSSASTSTSPNISVAEMYLTNEDPTTGISDVSWQQQLRQTVNVYSLSGRTVRRAVNRNDALRGLPAGLYIVDGQKIVVK